jgi:uracil-DNA glycosylase family 4
MMKNLEYDAQTAIRGATGHPYFRLFARCGQLNSRRRLLHISAARPAITCSCATVFLAVPLIPESGPPVVASTLDVLNRQIVSCERCPRLTEHCREVAVTKRRAYLDWNYWGKPVPSFGDPAARLLVIGLAPGAHGANRTGRMFTGDRSGEYLYPSLHRTGFASQPESLHAGDGLRLKDSWITAAAHCAPPGNKPSPGELRNCRPWLERELELLRNVGVVVVLGKLALDAYLSILKKRGGITRLADYRFGHNVLYPLQPALLCSYHPSQQNTSTGKLTQEMLDAVFLRARQLISRSAPVPAGRRP